MRHLRAGMTAPTELADVTDRWLLRAPALVLVAAMRRRELSPVELVEAHIARLQAINPLLNALIAQRFDAARREARAAEELLMRERDPHALPPLFGLPCTIKEFFAVEGMPNTGGLLARRDVRAQNDATVTSRLRQAGAIVLGVSNVPEGGMWMETSNKIWGRTNNPWDLSRTAGGSSGGEAALLAASGATFGVGSDIAGSIRIPAAFCGIVGHKPTGRMVPNTGQWGWDRNLERSTFLTPGPMGRCVRDLRAILEVIAGPDGIDPHTRHIRLQRADSDDLRGVTVYALESNGVHYVAPVLRQQIRLAAAALGRRGAEVRQLPPHRLGQSFAIWARAMEEAGVGGPSFAEILGDGERIELGWEAARMLLGRARVTFPALALAVLQRVSAGLPPRFAARIPTRHALLEEVEDALGERGILLYPPFSQPAPRHGIALLRPLDFVYTGIFSILELPVTQVPTGFDARGLPVGVQVASRRGGDGLTLAVAEALEQEFGGWVPAEPRAR